MVDESRKKAELILETRGLAKSFGGFMAVGGVDLKVRAGSIHALIGPNGAGKTTCFNLITKFLSPTEGSIEFAGRDVTRDGPAAVARAGLIRSFQISAVFPHLTAIENVRIALQRKREGSYAFWRSRRMFDDLNPIAMQLLERVGLAASANVPAVDMSYGRKRVLEIATTLALDPMLMLLDEPTAGMGHEDIDRIISVIREASAGRTVIMVEHNLRVVANLSDQVTVLARGKVLTEGSYAEVANDPKVREAYLGSHA